jgi:hypothetical protein
MALDKLRYTFDIARRFGWGEVKPGSVGIVKSSTSRKVTIDFPEQKSWAAKCSEIEVILRVGSSVRIKASITEPKYVSFRIDSRRCCIGLRTLFPFHEYHIICSCFVFYCESMLTIQLRHMAPTSESATYMWS